MRQSRLMSLAEALTSVVVGYGVAVLVQIALFPVFGIVATLGQNLAIGLVFTAVSIIRTRCVECSRPGVSEHAA